MTSLVLHLQSGYRMNILNITYLKKYDSQKYIKPVF